MGAGGTPVSNMRLRGLSVLALVVAAISMPAVPSAGGPTVAAADTMAGFVGRPVGVAVAQVKITRTLQMLGGRTVSADAASQFIWLWVVVKNFAAQKTGPILFDTDFTLAAPGGVIANSRCTTTEYQLPPNGTAADWLVFLVPKKADYTLVLNDGRQEIKKPILSVEWKAKQPFPAPPTTLECS